MFKDSTFFKEALKVTKTLLGELFIILNILYDYVFSTFLILNNYFTLSSRNTQENKFLLNNLIDPSDLEKYQPDNRGLHSIYVASNDLPNLSNLNEIDVFIGISNFKSLDVISNLDPSNVKRIYLIDININQLYYINKLIKLILTCKNKDEFVDKILGNNPTTPLSKELNKYNIDDKGRRVYKNLSRNTIGLKDVKHSLYQEDEETFYFISEKGFLSSERNFQNLKKNFRKNRPIYINDSLNRENLTTLLEENKYNNPAVWFSNIFSSYFVMRKPSLLYLCISLKYLLNKYNFTCIYDTRVEYIARIVSKCKNNPHIQTMRKLTKITKNRRVLEIVPVEKWSYQKIHKNFDRIFYKDVDCFDAWSSYDCIVLHILLGHGVDKQEFEQILQRIDINKLVLLEHNPMSKDFHYKKFDFDLEYLINVILRHNKQIKTEYVKGLLDDKRNIILY